LNDGARRYASVAGTYLETTFEKRVAKLAMMTFPAPAGRHGREFGKRVSDMLLSLIFRRPAGRRPLHVFALTAEHWAFVDHIRALLTDSEDEEIPSWWPQRHPWKTIRFQYEILREMERMASKDQTIRFRSFNLLPVFSQKRHFIGIDAAVLRHWMEKAKMINKVPSETFNALASEHRRSVFRLRSTWTLGNTFQSDGVSLCVHVLKAGAETELPSKKMRRRTRVQIAKDKRELEASYSQYADCRVIAVDPGRRAIVTSVELLSDGTRKHARFTRKQFYAESHANKNIEKRQRWRASFELHHPGVLEQLALVSSKTVSRERFDVFLLNKLEHDPVRWTEVGKRRTSLIVMDSYIHRRKALDHFWKRTTAPVEVVTPPRKVVIAYGDGAFPSGGRGERSVPKKSVKTSARAFAYRVVDVDEFRTTVMCADCGERTVAVKQLVRGRRRQVMGVRRCTSNACRKCPLKARDRAAAYNILKCFTEPERPHYLRRGAAA
jgi:hypothetical protein